MWILDGRQQAHLGKGWQLLGPAYRRHTGVRTACQLMSQACPQWGKRCILAGLAGPWVSTLEGSGGTRIRAVNVTSGVMRAGSWGLGG